MSDTNQTTVGCGGSNLSKADPEIFESIRNEFVRQRDNLELIASENYVSPAVLEAVGSVLTNKYAEGYPGKRYYGGCEYVDDTEDIARIRATELFGADNANVQPHAGSQANMASYFAMLKPGARIMAMSLAHGGHLTHGSKVNFSGRLFDIVPYGVRPDTCFIDYDQLAKTARETRPELIVAGASAYPRFIDFPAIREIADEIGALFMVDAAHFAGLVAGGAHPSPVPYADIVTMTTHKTLRGPRGGLILTKKEWATPVDKQIFPGIQGGPLMHTIAAKAVAFGEALKPEFKTYSNQIVANAKVLAQSLEEHGLKLVSGGTDNHLMLLDLTETGITGNVLEDALGRAHITVNKNAIPFDTQKPMVTSGVRLGTPALTTRGMKEDEMRLVGAMISRVVNAVEDKSVIEATGAEVRELAGSFPIFAW
jgi:glycine hydroxymethyltransferase